MEKASLGNWHFIKDLNSGIKMKEIYSKSTLFINSIHGEGWPVLVSWYAGVYLQFHFPQLLHK